MSATLQRNASAADTAAESGPILGATSWVPPTESPKPQLPPEADSRLNIRLSPEVRKALGWISATRGVSEVEAVRHAIATEKFFLELANQKAKVFVQVPGEKHFKEVVFAP
jgi:hypothetical protein